MTDTTYSVFKYKDLADIYREIQEIYLKNDYPWVVGYSGGKDSTATLQLIWLALAQLDSSELTKPIYVIASDTLVEAPAIVNRIESSLKLMSLAAQKIALPIITQKVVPQVEDTFWVSLIGKGYPAPSKRFRWCTERMKIKPANRFILERAAEFGEIVMVLGARKDESMSRAQVMSTKNRQIPGSRLTRHSELARAYVYTPVEDFTTNDVWEYLLQVKNPWGDNNRDLVALYRSAQSGECPLVIDDTTPSCGHSRFGCWVCTVVERDHSMENMIDNGEDWMEPMLEFRNMLSETQDPEKKSEFRSYKRRDGGTIYKEGDLIPGPYKPKYRKQFLRQLLEIQKTAQQTGPDPDLVLITVGELHEIRRIWREDFSDWEDSVAMIYREVMGHDIAWVQDTLGTFGSEEFDMLSEICEDSFINPELVARLVDLVRDKQGMGRRAGIYDGIHQIYNEEWREREDILRDYEEQLSQREELDLEK